MTGSVGSPLSPNRGWIFWENIRVFAANKNLRTKPRGLRFFALAGVSGASIDCTIKLIWFTSTLMLCPTDMSIANSFMLGRMSPYIRAFLRQTEIIFGLLGERLRLAQPRAIPITTFLSIGFSSFIYSLKLRRYGIFVPKKTTNFV